MFLSRWKISFNLSSMSMVDNATTASFPTAWRRKRQSLERQRHDTHAVIVTTLCGIFATTERRGGDGRTDGGNCENVGW